MNKIFGGGKLSEEQLREIRSKGGKRAQELGTGHKWTSEEAREAGRKGGKSKKKKGEV